MTRDFRWNCLKTRCLVLLGAPRMVHITDFACFHERGCYYPGDRGAPVYQTRAGCVGIAICYDHHYPEYTRALGTGGAEVVVIPQASGVGEWPEGLYEAEVRTAARYHGRAQPASCLRRASRVALNIP